MAQPPPTRKPATLRSSNPSRSTSGSRGKSPKRSGVGRIFGIGTLVLLGVLSIYGGSALRRSGLSKYIPPLFSGMLPNHSPADAFPDKTFNMLVVGRDYDYNDKDQAIRTHARSDMLMVAHIDFNKNDLTLFSIPRDTRAEIPGHGVSKINAAHAYGGPKLTEDTVQSNFGIPTQKYVALDFQGFEKAIDLLGGVDLIVDKKMDYDDNWGHLHIHLRPGYQHLNGEQAMGFVRFRHSDSDLIRIQRQQALLAAIKTKLHQPLVLAKLPDILGVIDKHIDSDLSNDQKIAMARFLHDTPHDQIQMATLPSNESAGPYVLTDWPKATPMIQKIFGVTPPENVASDYSPRRRHHHRRRVTRLAQLP